MSIIVHPEFKKLYEKYTDLKEQLEKLILNQDELTERICPIIKNDYLIKFGFLEYKVYTLEVELSRIKRKITMVQQRINHEKEINLEEIENQLNDEFEEFEERIQIQMDELNDAIALNNFKGLLTSEELKELKNLYKQIIKKLHPDLNKDLSEAEKLLFLNSVNAFKRGDLEILRGIALILSEENEDFKEYSNIDSIKKEIIELNHQIDRVSNNIAKIKGEYPYNKLDLLNDPEKSEEYILTLNDIIESKKELIKKFNLRCDELLEN